VQSIHLPTNGWLVSTSIKCALAYICMCGDGSRKVGVEGVSYGLAGGVFKMRELRDENGRVWQVGGELFD
jgi:hypothetical protein